MADQGRWFKLWISALNDPDLRNLSLEDFGRWCAFGAFLKEHGEDGRINLKSPAVALQELFRLPHFDGIVKVLESFPNCTVLVTPHVTNAFVTVMVEWRNWQKYQVDNSTERTRKWRERERSVTVGGDDDVTVREEKRREEKRREKKRREENKAETSSGGASPTPASGGDAWIGYAEAYQRRYGVQPVRNAKVNSQLVAFARRIPAAEAAEVAAWYVGNNAALYVRAGHPVDLLLRDAEKLRTEWATGQRVTEAGARASDQRQERGGIAERLLRKAASQEARHAES